MSSFVVETGQGLPTANAYASVAEADLYLANYGNPSEWTAGDTYAQGTLTLAAQPTNGDKMVIDNKTYTFQTTLTNVDGNIEIAASVSLTQERIVNAINLVQGTEGVGYAAAMTRHETVSIGAFAANVGTITARSAGSEGNSILLAETFTSPLNYFNGQTFLVSMEAVLGDNGGVFTDETSDANSAVLDDVVLIPPSPQINDAIYFGQTERFHTVAVKVSSVATDGTITWEYWTGLAWASLPTVTDQTTGFTSTGVGNVTFGIPTDWAATSVNGSDDLYFVRARVSAAGTTQALGAQVWTKANYLGGTTVGAEKKEESLRLATQAIDAEYGRLWIGRRTKESQRLDWPRIGVCDQDGWVIDSNVLPEDLKAATIELALRYIKGDTMFPDETTEAEIQRKKIRVGDIEKDITYVAGTGSTGRKQFSLVERLLVQFIMPNTVVVRA